MNKEQRSLLMASFWCDIFRAACVEKGINPVSAANSAVDEFSKRFPEEQPTTQYYCGICHGPKDHETRNCPALVNQPQILGPGFMGGLS